MCGGAARSGREPNLKEKPCPELTRCAPRSIVPYVDRDPTARDQQDDRSATSRSWRASPLCPRRRSRPARRRPGPARRCCPHAREALRSRSRACSSPDLGPRTSWHDRRRDGRRRQAVRVPQGPDLANIVLADEINRATPKTQSARSRRCRSTASPSAGARHASTSCSSSSRRRTRSSRRGRIRSEAQLDRFFMKIHVVGTALSSTPSRRTIEGEDARRAQRPSSPRRHPQRCSRSCWSWSPRLRRRTTPSASSRRRTRTAPDAPDACLRFVRFGASRGAQAVLLAAKIRSLRGPWIRQHRRRARGRVSRALSSHASTSKAKRRREDGSGHRGDHQGAIPDEDRQRAGLKTN